MSTPEPGEFFFGGIGDTLSNEDVDIVQAMYGPSPDEQERVGFPNFTYPEPGAQSVRDVQDAQEIAQGGGLFAYSNARRHPATGRPIIQNPDLSGSSERGISVESDLLNPGRVTNIPSIWDGHQLSEREAILRASQSGQQFPHFGTVDEAVQASIENSRMLGLAGQVPYLGLPDPNDLLMQRALRAMLGGRSP
jgi:hypothetical protein